jgi:hypothetical protein
MKSKTAEHAAKMKLREHLIVESKLRQQLSHRLKQDLPHDSTIEVVNQLVCQNENILAILNSSNESENDGPESQTQLGVEDSTLLV